jgi:hypothetical protein
MMLDQLEALVQPTQFLEHLRKTMSMTEGQLDMVSAMHEAIFRQINALEMLHKGGQRSVDKFISSGLHGLEKRKANTLQKAKRLPTLPAGTAAAATAAATRQDAGHDAQEEGLPSAIRRHKTEDCRMTGYSVPRLQLFCCSVILQLNWKSAILIHFLFTFVLNC